MDEMMEAPLIIKEKDAIVKAETIESDEIDTDNLLVNSESISMNRCDECGSTFLKTCALMSHKCTHYGEKPRLLEATPFIKEEIITKADGPIEVEEIAENKAKTIESADIEAGNLSKSVSSKKKFKCDECEKEFPKASALVYHKRMHSGEKPYQCSECDYASYCSGPLFQHKRVHSGEKPYACNECDYMCSRSGDLKRHKLIHSGEKPYSCDVCDYFTTQKGCLISHKMIHTGERPYKCDLCDKTFQRKDHVVSHRRTHTGEKIVPKFVFTCSECGFTTNGKWNLKNHEATHSEARPFACNQCNFKCKRKGILKKHERTHSGERPYSCADCGKKFAQSGALSKHKKRIHSKQTVVDV